ncbi:MAG: hypothetical protein HOP18_21535 [Deltaproteobacteria bacterium]|nr:hypothetical protein [Deltaproteobacteria bacterium]
MAQTGIVINKESWSLLREEPLYCPRFIDRAGTDELALVVRVELIDFFLDAHPPLTIDLSTWQSAHGTWVVIVTYRLHPTFGPETGGMFFLNPRHVVDSDILGKFLRQEALAVVFLNEDCAEHYTMRLVFDPRAMARWEQQIGEMKTALGKSELREEHDEEFEQAVRELQGG